MESLYSLSEDEDRDMTVTDAEFAEGLQFQEVLIASLSLQDTSASSSSSSSALKHCKICMDDKETSDMFEIETCFHSFCSDCIREHIQAKIQQKIYPILCPDADFSCSRIMEPSSCRSIVPEEVLARWETMRSESIILVSQKVYCPFQDCSAILVNDEEIIGETQCPECRRQFCVQCLVPWHDGSCEEFQKKLNEDRNGNGDIMFGDLAREFNWMKCPNCNIIIERTDGCIHMTCRCRFEFCYICGSEWNESHWECQRE